MAVEWAFWSVTNRFWFELEVGIGTGSLLPGPGSFYLLHKSLKFGGLVAPVTKFVTHLTDSFSPYPHHLKSYVAMAMLSHPRIGILGSLIKGLPDLWPRLNDETAFGHFFDRTKNNLVIHITN